ncbi:MAG TPA: hypothetical protein VMV91_04280 [Rhodocyclaceae bacterium]|nr:hypothetical protein [Rhodocyclaceae bacterium]
MINALIDLLGNFYRAGQLTRVEAIAASILTAIPDDLVSLQFLGLVYHRTGRTREALRLFQQAADSQDRFADFHCSSDPDECSRCPYAAADACYLEAHSPNLAEAWYELGLALRELGQPRLAASALRSALVARRQFQDAAADVSLAATGQGGVGQRASAACA